jgi:hypothetical protein
MRYAPTELADHTCVIIILNYQFSILNWNQFSIGINSQLESILNWNQFSFAPVSRLFWSQVSRSQTVGVRKSLISSSDALL